MWAWHEQPDLERPWAEGALRGGADHSKGLQVLQGTEGRPWPSRPPEGQSQHRVGLCRAFRWTSRHLLTRQRGQSCRGYSELLPQVSTLKDFRSMVKNIVKSILWVRLTRNFHFNWSGISSISTGSRWPKLRRWFRTSTVLTVSTSGSRSLKRPPCASRASTGPTGNTRPQQNRPPDQAESPHHPLQASSKDVNNRVWIHLNP